MGTNGKTKKEKRGEKEGKGWARSENGVNLLKHKKKHDFSYFFPKAYKFPCFSPKWLNYEKYENLLKYPLIFSGMQRRQKKFVGKNKMWGDGGINFQNIISISFKNKKKVGVAIQMATWFFSERFKPEKMQ